MQDEARKGLLADVAGDVIARKLRFDARSGQKDPVR